MTTDQQQDIDRVLALVNRHARHFAHDEDAEDLAQVAALKVWCGWKDEMREWKSVQFNAWIWHIVQNAWTDMHKRHRVQTEELRDVHYTSGSVESGMEARELIARVFSHLTKRQRVLLSLDAQGYTYKEIAAWEHSTRGSVASALSRAKITARAQRDREAA